MTEAPINNEISVRVQPTPNPSAWKFILEKPILTEGKASFSTAEEAFGNPLALELLKIADVKQVHFFQNVITITAQIGAEEDVIAAEVKAVLQKMLSTHNPDFGLKDSKLAKRAELPEDVQKIEEILDRTIRPGLQGDGGDIEVVKFEEKKLYVHYEGACGTCPSATSGTLMAIEGILRDEFMPDLEVIPV